MSDSQTPYKGRVTSSIKMGPIDGQAHKKGLGGQGICCGLRYTENTKVPTRL